MMKWHVGCLLSGMLSASLVAASASAAELGYKVEYVTAGNYPQFEGLSDGSLSATLEVWMNNVGDIFPKALEAGKIVDMGQLNLKTQEGWVYPKYMTDICP